MLYEIRDMLADLQKSVTSTLKENSILREDVKQLKLSLQLKEREVSVLKALEKVSKANESLNTELQQTQVEEADNLYTALDDFGEVHQEK